MAGDGCDGPTADPDGLRAMLGLQAARQRLAEAPLEVQTLEAHLAASTSLPHAHAAHAGKTLPAVKAGSSAAGLVSRRAEMPQPKPWRHLAEAQAEIARLREEGALLPLGANGRVVRVYVDGCFDGMHSGHMNAVRQAKQLAEEVGGVLVVGVHSDAEIAQNKGPPLMSDEERMAVVAAVKWVDELIFDVPYSLSLGFLDSLDIDFCVHGDDMTLAADGTDAYGEAKAAGRMRVIKRTEGVSTTDIVGRLLLQNRDESAEPDAQHTAGNGAAVDAARPTHSDEPPALTYSSSNMSSNGVSQFLPTTFRLRQFSTGRSPLVDERVVYIDGAFDLLHAGHVEWLFHARALGDFLVVGLHDDSRVKSTLGEDQPVMSLHERALCILSLSCVDEVILGTPWVVTTDLMRTMNVARVVCSEAEADAERFAVPREAGVLVTMERSHPLGTSISGIVERVLLNRERYERRNVKRERKELNYVENEKAYVPEL